MNIIFNYLSKARTADLTAPLRVSSLFLFLVFSSISLQGTALNVYLGIDNQPETLSLPEDSIRVEQLIKESRNADHIESSLSDIEIASQAVDLSFKFNDGSLYAKALDNLGLIYRFRQQYADALELHSKAFSLIKNSKSEPALQKMIYANNAGLAARYSGKYKTATTYYLQALQIAEENDDAKNISISSNGLGLTYMAIPDMEQKGLFYLFKALQIAKSKGNKKGTAMNLIAICNYYIEKDLNNIARFYLQELLEINQEINDKFGLGVTYLSFSDSFIKEDIDKSEFYLLKSIEIFTSLNNSRQLAIAYYQLADLYRYSNKDTQSMQMYRQSFNAASKLKLWPIMRYNAGELYKLYEKSGDYKTALEYHKKKSEIADSINLNDQITQINILDRKYDFSQKEQQIRLLTKDKEVHESQMKLQKEKVRISVVVMVILIICFCTFLILNNINKKRSRKIEQLIQEQEKDKIKADYEKTLLESRILAQQTKINPHLIFNCLNAIKYLIQTDQHQIADRYILHLSRYIRLVLETSKEPTISLSEEINLIQHYIKLEQIRFRDSFEFIVENKLEPNQNIHIPTLLTQPYVENAIWHGLLPKNSESRLLKLLVYNAPDGTVRIIIDDNGVGRSDPDTAPKETFKKSMGSIITQERVRLFNEENQGKPPQIAINIIDKKDVEGQPSGTCVELIITRA